MSVEIESKFTVDAADFANLLGSGRVLDSVDQLNVYYDDNRRISTMAGTFRLRLMPGRAPVLTLKVPQWQRGAVRGSTELEEDAPRRVPPRVILSRDLPAAFADLLGALDIERLERLGWMRNQRVRVEMAEGILADFDRSTLPNRQVAFEIEIESDEDAVHTGALRIISAGAKSASASRVNKYQRFLAALDTTHR